MKFIMQQLPKKSELLAKVTPSYKEMNQSEDSGVLDVYNILLQTKKGAMCKLAYQKTQYD